MMRQLKLIFVLLIFPALLYGQTGWSTGGSGAFADSARAASIADSAKHAAAWVQDSSWVKMGTDVIVQHTAGKDTIGFWSNLKVRPWKKAAQCDSVSQQYAVIADASQSGLDPGYSDYAVFQTVVFDSLPAYDGNHAILWSKGYDATNMIQLSQQKDATGYKLVLFMRQGGTAVSKDFYFDAQTSKSYNILSLYDRDGNEYLYVDGESLGSTSISAISGDVDNSVGFYIGTNSYGSVILRGKVLVTRVFNFGTDGAPSDPDAFARALARRPLATMAELGYPEYEDADWTNVKSNPGIENGTTGYNLYNGATIAQDATNVHGGSYALLAKDAGATDFYGTYSNSFTTTLGAHVYELSFLVYHDGASNADFRAQYWDAVHGAVSTTTSVAPSTWTQLRLVFEVQSDAVSASKYVYAICTSSVPDSFWVDDFDVHEVGEVARWDFNDASSSTVFADKTSNDNDLTPYSSGATTTAGNLQETAWLNHGFFAKAGIDTVVADTTFSWNVLTRRVYFENDDVPGAGTTDPLLYASGGEIYAHDASGNNTVISPHMDGDWVYNSWNAQTGLRTFINLFDLVKVLEKLTGRKLMYQDTVAVQIPVEQAVDTVYVTVVDTIKHLTSRVRVLRPRKHVININGKWYRIDAAKIRKPPAAYLEAIGVKPW